MTSCNNSSCSSSTCEGCGLKTNVSGKVVSSSRARHPDAECLESGRIYWFYRPRVTLKESHDYSEVQRLYFLLAPASCPSKPCDGDSGNMPKRLFVMTSKTMPESRGHTRHWAFVDMVSDKLEDLHAALEKKEYDTKTRGHRVVESCRPAGEGVYELLWIPSKPQACLAYVLEVPSTPGDVQKAFHIQKEASYIVQVKNPENSTEGAPGLAAPQKAHFPADLQEKFKGVRVESRKFIPVETPEFLNYPHTELLMIGESDDLVAEFGKVGESLEKTEKLDEEKQMKELNGHMEDEPYKELGLTKEEFPSKPLSGKWEGEGSSGSSSASKSSSSPAKKKAASKGSRGKAKAAAADEDGDANMKASSKKGRGTKRAASLKQSDATAAEPSPPKKNKPNINWTGRAC